MMTDGLHRRILLEAFKFLGPEDLLRTDLVCGLWHNCSCDDEVWAAHLPFFPAEAPLKLACKEQLRVPRFLAFISMSSMTITDLQTLQASRVSLRSPFEPSFFATWVSLPRSVVYCGGLRASKYTADCFVLDIRTGDTEKLPDMLSHRAGGALVFSAGRVYMFGGEREQSKPGIYGYLKACEKLTMAAKKWTALPEMSTPRRSFTPALSEGRVFLAGGDGASPVIEIFLLASEEFVTAAFALSFNNAPTISFVMGDSLVVIGHSSVWEFNMTSGNVREERNVRFEYWYSPGGVVACQGRSYFGVYYESQLFCIGRDLAVTTIAAI